MMRISSQPGREHYAARVLPFPEAEDGAGTALEMAMQALALDDSHPVALEIAGDEHGRFFLLRATSATALVHMQEQIQARYPQAVIEPLIDDPFQVREGEAASVVELRPGAPSYVPLRTWNEREWQQPGTDPVLGILGALTHLPSGTRAIAQLALLPASPSWSRESQRKAYEHPLEHERTQQRQMRSRSTSTAPGMGSIVGLALLVLVLLTWRAYQKQIAHLVPWLAPDLAMLLHGKTPHLGLLEVLEIGGTIVAFLLLTFLVTQLPRLLGIGQRRVYDMRLVAEKTKRLAYHARLRLIVIGPRNALLPEKPVSCLPPHLVAKEWREIGQTLRAYLVWWWQSRQQSKERSRERRAVLDHLIAAYRQYHLVSAGFFVPGRYSATRARRLFVSHAGMTRRAWPGWASGLKRSHHYLSVAEIASLWHLPQERDVIDLPLMQRGRSRTFLVPDALTSRGWPLGMSVHAGHQATVYLPPDGLQKNLLAVASTGKGKSTLFQHLADARLHEIAQRQNEEAGARESLCIMEPHGDMLQNLIGRIPASMVQHVVFINLADEAYPPALNVLDMSELPDRDKVTDTVVAVFKSFFGTSWGRRTENIMEYALKSLVEANITLVQADRQSGSNEQYTLLDVVPLLRNAGFRKQVLKQLADPTLRQWWYQYYEAMHPDFQTEVVSSVINKISKYAGSRVARRLLGRPRSSIRMKEIIHAGKILLIATSSGLVGTEVSSLIGTTLLGLFHMALAEQAALALPDRCRYLVLIDEFQAYEGVNYNTMLAELRKYGGTFGLATQSLAYLDKLDRTLRPTVLSNIDHLYAFDMSAEDARMLQPELDGIAVEDIVNQDDFSCYVKLSLGGQRLPVFSLRLNPPGHSTPERQQQVRTFCQRQYGCPKEMVDAELEERLKTRMLKEEFPQKEEHAPKPAERTRVRGPRSRKKEEEASANAPLAGETEQSVEVAHRHSPQPDEEERAERAKEQ